MTFNSFMAEYKGQSPEILSVQNAFQPRKGRVTENSLVKDYGPEAHFAWAAFVKAGGH